VIAVSLLERESCFLSRRRNPKRSPRAEASNRHCCESCLIELTVVRTHGAGAELTRCFRGQAQRGSRRGHQTGAVQLAAVGAGGGAVNPRGVTPRGRRGGRGSSGVAALRLVDTDAVAGTAGVAVAAAGQVSSGTGCCT
jgi:hypothetical protein